MGSYKLQTLSESLQAMNESKADKELDEYFDYFFDIVADAEWESHADDFNEIAEKYDMGEYDTFDSLLKATSELHEMALDTELGDPKKHEAFQKFEKKYSK